MENILFIIAKLDRSKILAKNRKLAGIDSKLLEEGNKNDTFEIGQLQIFHLFCKKF